MEGVNRPAEGSPGSPTCHSVPNVRPLGMVRPCPHPALWSPSVQRKSPRRPKTLPAQVFGDPVVPVHLAEDVLPCQTPRLVGANDGADHDRCITNENWLLREPWADLATCSKAHLRHQGCLSSHTCVNRSKPATSLAVSGAHGLPCTSTCLAIASAEAQLQWPRSTSRSNVRNTSSGASHDNSCPTTWAVIPMTETTSTLAEMAILVTAFEIILPNAKTFD